MHYNDINNMKLTDSVEILDGVGPARLKQLQGANIRIISDIVNYFPRKYDDYSSLTTISAMRPGLVCLEVKFSQLKVARVRRGLHITNALASDASGGVRVVWFNQPYRLQSIDTTKTYLVRGEYGLSANKLQIVNPSIELSSSISSNSSGIIPTYKETKDLKSTFFRKIIKKNSNIFELIEETLPTSYLVANNLVGKKEAIKNLHLPKSLVGLDQAQARLGFEEILTLMLAAKAIKNETISESSKAIPFAEQVAKDFVKNLPFKLTDEQRRVVWQIYKDMAQTRPMNRLVEGDVGSGKTVIAAMSGAMAAENNYQVAFLAPTELLAQQHFQTISQFLSHTKYKNQLGLLTGSISSKEKKELKSRLANHEIKFIVGTHALLQEDINWHRLGLVIIDEQHRFGVEQRQKIITKAGHMPHVLCLTATPIPRSLALTIYGELDISILKSAPTTRAGVRTELISPNSTLQMYQVVKKSVLEGRQAFVVCPLIENSEISKLTSAEQIYQELTHGVFKDLSVGLVHGRLKPKQKNQIMTDFAKNKIQVLVATTVIEVGIDVPNATEMVILNANRFGLAQLHQLRGRVGRGVHPGTCYLVMSDSLAPSKRMRAMQETSDGFQLAELDLSIRGPGAIYGVMQHGSLDLSFAKITDVNLIARVRQFINSQPNILEDMLKYKQLTESVKKATRLIYLN
ncbi:ATP-dependent DNA helicase RecG [Candidatus Nomurabacteria bacterium]|jgi:ATP-dependent DNA helicase RecG|nr:ATP-dependent DNA helicase RecG [Candidatus Nomurabacteria bacterium]